MTENLLEHGGSEQYSLIKPYLDLADKYDPNIHKDIERFFADLLDSALAVREEREVLPKWAMDVKDYVMKSEIMICCTLFGHLAFSDNAPKEVPNFINAAPDEDEEEETLPMFPLTIMQSLHPYILDFGKERGWSSHILWIQLHKAIGMEMGIPSMKKYLLPKVHMGKDYN